MATYTTDLKDWASSGNAYPSGYSYQADKPPVDVYDNFFNSNVINDIQHLINLTNDRIESDKGSAGGEPVSPEMSHLYHDIDNERLRVYDSAQSSWYSHLRRDGDTMAGTLNMSGYSVSSVGDITDNNGNLVYDSTNEHVPQSTVQQGPGSGLDADTVDGNEAAALGSGASNNGTQLYSSVTDFNFSTNLNVSDDGDGTVTIESVDTNTQTAVSEDGSQRYSNIQDINFEGHLNVIDDGDGTVSLDPTHNHDSRYLRIGTDEGDGNGLNADAVDGYDIQKNGTDGSGIINFKT
jgi:hypothetical protein